MSKAGILGIVLALAALAFYLKWDAGRAPQALPSGSPLDGPLETIDRARDSVARANDAVWRQREGLAKASPELFIKDLEASSARQPFTREEARRAVEIARANAIAAAWEGASLRIGGAAIRLEPVIVP